MKVKKILVAFAVAFAAVVALLMFFPLSSPEETTENPPTAWVDVDGDME